MSLRHRIFAAGLDLTHALRLDRAAASSLRGLGVILTLHRVRPAELAAFAPNAILEITPAFLANALELIRQLGFRLVSLDAALDLIVRPDGGAPFAVLTFDDGYRDNMDHALPVLERFAVPAILFAVPGFLDRTATLWWVDLEDAIARLDHVRVDQDGLDIDLPNRSAFEKNRSFAEVYAALRAGPEERLRSVIATLAARAGIDTRATVAAACLDWAELRSMAAHPLMTIGAHTLTHPFLAQQTEAQARHEMAASRARLQTELGVTIAHIAYPVGDRMSAGAREFGLAQELGFRAGVTTRPGMVFAPSRAHPAALPRISLNGLFQDVGRLEALLSGAPTFVWNGGRRLDVA